MHPTGERFDPDYVVFSSPADTATSAAAVALAAHPKTWPEAPAPDYPDVINLDDPIYGVIDDEPDAWFG